MPDIHHLQTRIQELEELLDLADRKSDILTNLLKEASAEFETALEKVTISEANFRAIFENAPEAIYIFCTETRHILDCNAFTIEWLGYSRSELLTRRVDDLLVPGTTGIDHNVSKVVEEGSVRISERRFCKKDGSLTVAEVTGALIGYAGRPAMVALVRDITERKTFEELSRYKELFDNVSDPVFISDARGRFLEVNDPACECFQYPRQQLLQMAVRDVISPGQQQLAAEMGTRLQRGTAVTFELEMLTRQGQRIPFECHSRSITFMGQAAILSVARDLSVRKQMEETLIRNERLSALGSMATGVAHNFNNLLQMIVALSEAAASKLEAGRIRETRDAIHYILEAGRRGADTVRRIRNFTGVRPGKDTAKEVFDLGSLLEEVLALTQPLWGNPQNAGLYTLQVDTPPDCIVNANVSEMYEVLINLIKNAIEAMPDGGTLKISAAMTENQVHLIVADTGCGIPPENLERVFEPFFTTKGTRSSGLGLPSSYGIIKRNQGTMTVTSRWNQGATFCITLPRAASLPAPATPDPHLPARAKIRFLLIDDETNILKAMELFFEDTNIELISTDRAAEGLKILETVQPDVILCDLGMDDMNGWEVGRTVKALYRQKGRSKIPFILYTGLDTSLDARKLEEIGIDRVVTKPVSCQELAQIIQEVIQSQRKD